MKCKREGHVGGRKSQEVGSEEGGICGELLTKDWGLKGVKYSVPECTLKAKAASQKKCSEYVNKRKKEEKQVKWFYVLTF